MVLLVDHLVDVVVQVFADIFRSDDLGGWGKALWIIFVIVVPFLGVFVYFIARGKDMGQRDIDHALAQQQQFNAYVQDVAATTASPADQLTKLADLHRSGVLTDAEFEQQKAKLLA